MTVLKGGPGQQPLHLWPWWKDRGEEEETAGPDGAGFGDREGRGTRTRVGTFTAPSSVKGSPIDMHALILRAPGLLTSGTCM